MMEVREQIYTHEYLWRASTAALNSGEGDSAQSYLRITSLLMAYLAYEAFVNFIGRTLLPEVWALEKENFRGRGTAGKLEKIVQKLPSFTWQKGANPYQAIARLEEFRDLVAHGKVAEASHKAVQRENGRHFLFQHPWDPFLESGAVEQARAFVVDFCQSLLVAARLVSDEPHLIFDAFEGSLAHGEGSQVRG